MFDNYGRPTGMGQNSPFTDAAQPKGQPSQPAPQQQQSPLATAIGAPQYPTDPGMAAWARKPGRQQIAVPGAQQGGAQPPSPFGIQGPPGGAWSEQLPPGIGQQQAPPPQGLPTKPSAGAPGGAQGGGINDFIRNLIKSGVSPQDAANQANKAYGRTHGNEAVFYPDTNTIGLPDTYMDGASGWGDVQRQHNGGGSPFNMNGSLMSAISGGQQGGQQESALNTYLRLLQTLNQGG